MTQMVGYQNQVRPKKSLSGGWGVAWLCADPLAGKAFIPHSAATEGGPWGTPSWWQLHYKRQGQPSGLTLQQLQACGEGGGNKPARRVEVEHAQ